MAHEEPDQDPDASTDVLKRRAKALLRKRARALRGAVPPAALAERSARIAACLEALSAFAAARRVALFWPIEGRNEVDLTALDPVLRARGARVAYPSIHDETRVMTFRFVEDPKVMRERGLGFADPGPEAEEATSLDAIVVPALQLDERGYRIGYGAGYYDRALPRFAPPARTFGVAFDFQLVMEVPVTAGDVPVDIVITDRRTLTAER